MSAQNLHQKPTAEWLTKHISLHGVGNGRVVHGHTDGVVVTDNGFLLVIGGATNGGIES